MTTPLLLSGDETATKEGRKDGRDEDDEDEADEEEEEEATSM